MQRTVAPWKVGKRRSVLGVLLVLVLAFPGRAFPAAATDGTPAGMDESEYNRLRRVGAGRGVPDFLSPEALVGLSDATIAAIQRDFLERGRLQVQSDNYLDYDEQRNIIYSNGRTRIRFDQYMLEADRVLVQVPLQEIQAEGNVILRAWADPALRFKTDEIHSKAMVFNYKVFEGAASEARGQHDVLYFRCAESASGMPGFQMIGRDEALFRNADFTTDDFPDPQYTMHTQEGILVFNDRVFMRNAVLRVRHIPVFWLPYYTKSLREAMPWSIYFGTSNRLGPWISVRYSFYHYRYEPSFEDPKELELRDRGKFEPRLDVFGRRGVGIGATYDYGFNFDQHRGHVAVYGMPSDNKRDVPDGSTSRWQAFALHRSELRKDLIFNLNVDYMSDPEFYYDLFDPIEAEERGRVPERRARAALTYWKDDYIARVLFDVRERITRDRITDTASPTDDDADYDIFPGTSKEFHRDDGLPSSRYGLVSLRLPQVTAGTNHIRIGGQSPLFYTLDVNAFNNLDKGLNFHSTGDDSFVVGLDIYQQLSYLFKFSERYTLLAQIGAGLGFMKRLDDSWHYDRDDFRREDGTFRQDISFVDENTFRINNNKGSLSSGLVGPLPGPIHLGGREVSLDDYQPGFAYGDIRLRFRGRFTDSLTGNVYYILTEGVKDSLSEFYESIGNRTALTDLYNYRIRKHWLAGDLTYHLAYPDITMGVTAGRNLQSQSDIYANEPIQYATVRAQWRNQARTAQLMAYAGYDQRQIRNPEDEFQYQRDSVSAGFQGVYVPISRRWWVSSQIFLWKALTSDPSKQDTEEDYARPEEDDYRYVDENRTDFIIDTWIGRKISEKWTAELGTEWRQAYGGLRDLRFSLSRNLHNAIATMYVRYHRTPYEESNPDLNIGFNIQFKLPGPMDTVLAPRARTLMTEQRVLAIAEGDLPGI